jgi:hypothetical protein
MVVSLSAISAYGDQQKAIELIIDVLFRIRVLDHAI